MTEQPFESRFERMELKYVIGEGTAARIREQIEPYTRPDAHNRISNAGNARGYPIRSLYLDTPGLAFHLAKERGDPERFKLRIRRYRGLLPPCLEIKRRSCDVIEKTRAFVDHGKLRETAHGFGRTLEETAESRAFADRFARLVLTTGAEPTLLVRYEREAFDSEVDSYARITFDRNVEFQRTGAWTLEGRPDDWRDLESHMIDGAPRPLVVLEIKCATVMPHWMGDVIRENELRRDNISKYSLGIYVTRRVDGLSRGQERARGVLR